MSELLLKDLADPATTVGYLLAGGQRGAIADETARRLGECGQALTATWVPEKTPVRAFFVPGRIEVLGKHTDYAGGRSLVAAAEQGFCLVAAPREDAAIHAAALDLDGRCEFEISPNLTPTVGHWSNYPMTVARRVARNFPGKLRGATLAFASDLPVAAGMSSSSALMVSIFHALAAVNGLADREEYRREIADRESLAGYLGTIENGQSFGRLEGDKGVGTFGGSEDHVAMLCGRAGMLSQYSYCPVRLERRIAFPDEYVFAIAASGVVAAKTGRAMDKYNRASALARAVVDAWNEATGRDDPHIAAALAGDDTDEAADRLRQALMAHSAGPEFSPKELLERFGHFFMENQRIIPGVPDALDSAGAALATFGELVDLSQDCAEKLLGNQVPETIHLARTARELGAGAASAFGAGFGGSVWAMVREDQADGLLRDWTHAYRTAFPEPAQRAAFFLTRPGPPAFELGDGSL